MMYILFGRRGWGVGAGLGMGGEYNAGHSWNQFSRSRARRKLSFYCLSLLDMYMKCKKKI